MSVGCCIGWRHSREKTVEIQYVLPMWCLLDCMCTGPFGHFTVSYGFTVQYVHVLSSELYTVRAATHSTITSFREVLWLTVVCYYHSLVVN